MRRSRQDCAAGRVTELVSIQHLIAASALAACLDAVLTEWRCQIGHAALAVLHHSMVDRWAQSEP